MRAAVQRVSRARVSVDGEVVGAIGEGLLVLVGVARDDTSADVAVLVDKLAGLRIFADEAGSMNRSVEDIGGGVLVVSQFTLYADVRRGRRPSFSAAADSADAEPLVAGVLAGLGERGIPVAGGRFGALMEVELVNSGPVTVLVESQAGRIL